MISIIGSNWFSECLIFSQVKEKTVAARRSGVKTIIFPLANKRDYDELPPHVQEGLEVHFVDHYSEIFDLAFNIKPEGEKQLAIVETELASPVSLAS
jgi:Lon-like ATP-dependent protease